MVAVSFDMQPVGQLDARDVWVLHSRDVHVFFKVLDFSLDPLSLPAVSDCLDCLVLGISQSPFLIRQLEVLFLARVLLQLNLDLIASTILTPDVLGGPEAVEHARHHNAHLGAESLGFLH